MNTRPLSKFFTLALSAGLSAAWLGTVVVGMQSSGAPVMHTIELPTVVIVARKNPAPDATAQVKPAAAKNS